MKNDLVTMLDLFEADGMISKNDADTVRKMVFALNTFKSKAMYGTCERIGLCVSIYEDYMRAISNAKDAKFEYSFYIRGNSWRHAITGQELIDLVKKHGKDLRFDPDNTIGIIKVLSMSNSKYYYLITNRRNIYIATMWYSGYSSRFISYAYKISRSRVSDIIMHMNKLFKRVTEAYSEGNEDSIERLLFLPSVVKSNLVKLNGITSISELNKMNEENILTSLVGIGDKYANMIKRALVLYYGDKEE